jgi:integrase
MQRGGLRAPEAAALDLSDYDRSARTLTVRGKRRNARVLALEINQRAALDAWIEIRGTGSGPLFPRLHAYRIGRMSRLSAGRAWELAHERR